MNTDHNPMLRVLVGVAAVCVLLAGCGDGGGGEDAATTISSSTPSTATSPSTDDDVDAGEGEGGDFCQLSEELTRLFGELDGSGAEATWLGIESVVAEMQAASPPVLEADVAIAVRYYPLARAELEAADWDVGVLEALAAEYRAEHGAAEENIHAYLATNC